MSGGCSRCCSYGSLGQRISQARRLAMVIDMAIDNHRTREMLRIFNEIEKEEVL
jgi:hypothetical protein